MKPTIEVQQSKGSLTRITITPNSVTLKVPQGTSERYENHSKKFAEYCVEQFVDIKKTWRGIVHFKLDGMLHVYTRLEDDTKQNFRKYEVVF